MSRALGHPRRRQRAAQARRSPTTSSRQTVDTTDEWIVERTGIRSRYIAGDGETTATLATDAARRALDHAGHRRRRDIDLIVLATATPDQTFPSSATKVQAALGIDDCIAFDVHAVCTGFLYALSVADSMLRSRQRRQGAGDRRGDVQPDPRLGGSRDLRPVRRRRRRARARRRGRRARHPRHQAPRRRPPQRPAVRRRRPVDHRHRRQAADEGPRGVPPRGRQPRRRCSTKCSTPPA